MPESFKVLIKELQSLALDMKVFSDDHQEIAIRESIDDDQEILDVMVGREDVPVQEEPAYEPAPAAPAAEEEDDYEDIDLDGLEDIPSINDLGGGDDLTVEDDAF